MWRYRYIYTFFISLSSLLLLSCGSPKGFTYHYEGKYTGLDTLIDIEGYYVAQRGCDSLFYSVFMFYPDGLFTIATTSEVLPELVDCFENGGKSTLCKYPLWGMYQINGDTIQTQAVREEGGGCIIYRNYRVNADKSLLNISDYVLPHNTKLGYMANYPSFTYDDCPTPAELYPLKKKRNISECPLLNKAWFSKKEE